MPLIVAGPGVDQGKRLAGDVSLRYYFVVEGTLDGDPLEPSEGKYSPDSHALWRMPNVLWPANRRYSGPDEPMKDDWASQGTYLWLERNEALSLAEGFAEELFKNGKVTIGSKTLTTGLPDWTNANSNKIAYNHEHNDHVHVSLDRSKLNEGTHQDP